MKYIGYSRLEQFVEHIDPSQILYLILAEEIIPSADGIALFCSELLLQVSIGDGLGDTVLYWRMRIGRALAPGGQPWPEEARKIRTAGKSALEAIKKYLAVQENVKHIEEGALIALPRDLNLLTGYAEFLQFDKKSGTYKSKEVSICNEDC